MYVDAEGAYIPTELMETKTGLKVDGMTRTWVKMRANFFPDDL